MSHPKLQPFASANQIAAETLANINLLMMTCESAWGIPYRKAHSLDSLIAQMVPFPRTNLLVPTFTTSQERPLLELFRASNSLAGDARSNRYDRGKDSLYLLMGEWFAPPLAIIPGLASAFDLNRDKAMIEASVVKGGYWNADSDYFSNHCFRGDVSGIAAASLPRLHALELVSFHKDGTSKKADGSRFLRTLMGPIQRIEHAVGPEDWSGGPSCMLTGNAGQSRNLLSETVHHLTRLICKDYQMSAFRFSHGDLVDRMYLCELESCLHDAEYDYMRMGGHYYGGGEMEDEDEDEDDWQE